MERENQQIGGYFFTSETREALQNNPDIHFRTSERSYAFVFGERQNPGDPNYSVFCSVTRNGQVRELASGGITFEDALHGIGSEVNALRQRYEAISTRLHSLEEAFGLDLSASREIPLDHTDFVKSYASKFAQWAQAENLIDDLSARTLTENISNFLVLAPQDRKVLLMASARENIDYLQSVKVQAVNSGEWDSVAGEMRQAFNELLQLFINNLEFYESEDFGPASKFGYTDSSGNKVVLAVFDDWSNGDFYSGQSLEGAIAEETMHVAAGMQGLAETLSINSVFLHEAEEIAVEYYAAGAMRACGVGLEQIERYTTLNPDCIPMWDEFINAKGRETADALFFRGECSQKDWDYFEAIVRR